MAEYIITDNELIVFLTCNRENLDIYTDDYFNQFNIEYNMSVIKKWDENGVIKGGEGEPSEIKMPYKFFYDKLEFLKKIIEPFLKKPEETPIEEEIKPNVTEKTTVYDLFEKGLGMFKSDKPLKEASKPLDDIDKTEHPVGEEPYNSLLTLQPLKIDTDKKEEPVVMEESLVKEEPVKEEQVIEEPIIEEAVMEEPKESINEYEKLKFVFPLHGEEVKKLEKSKLHRMKQLLPFIKYLLKKGIRWDRIDGFKIGDREFIIGDYTEICIESSTKLDDMEIENTEIYKLIIESEC